MHCKICKLPALPGLFLLCFTFKLLKCISRGINSQVFQTRKLLLLKWQRFCAMVSYFQALPQLHIFLTICFFLAASDREAGNCIRVTVWFDIWYLNPTVVFICESFKYEIILVTVAASSPLTSSTLFTPGLHAISHMEKICMFSCLVCTICVCEYKHVDISMCVLVHSPVSVLRPNVDVGYLQQ